MRHRALMAVAALAALGLSACGSDDKESVTGTATVIPAATSSVTGAPSATYSADARALMNDLAVAQRGLADAIAGNAPLSDAWKQAVSTRASALAGLEERAQKLIPPVAQQASHAQLQLAVRRSREAADTIAAAVADGNVSMLERANALLADAAFQTAAAVSTLPR